MTAVDDAREKVDEIERIHSAAWTAPARSCAPSSPLKRSSGDRQPLRPEVWSSFGVDVPGIFDDIC